MLRGYIQTSIVAAFDDLRKPRRTRRAEIIAEDNEYLAALMGYLKIAARSVRARQRRVAGPVVHRVSGDPRDGSDE
jgi:hypothetical protein